jgi:predicted transcriptional regulator
VQQSSVRDLMRIRHGLVVTETTTVREVAERLIISDCDLMAVTDAAGKLIGVVCESSIVRVLLSNPAPDMTIQSLVIRHVESVRLDSNIAAAQPLFRSCANTAIPVVNESGIVCGLLMRSDVIRSLLNRNAQSVDAATGVASEKSSVAGPIVAAAKTNSSMAFTPPKKRMIHAGDADSSTPANQPRPHFHAS